MNEELQASAVAAWLDAGGEAPPPAGVDPDVLEAVYALRPERAPAPQLDLDALLDSVRTGPLANQLTGPVAEGRAVAPAEGVLATAASPAQAAPQLRDAAPRSAESARSAAEDAPHAIPSPELGDAPAVGANRPMSTPGADSRARTAAGEGSSARSRAWRQWFAGGAIGSLAAAAAALVVLGGPPTSNEPTLESASRAPAPSAPTPSLSPAGANAAPQGEPPPPAGAPAAPQQIAEVSRPAAAPGGLSELQRVSGGASGGFAATGGAPMPSPASAPMTEKAESASFSDAKDASRPLGGAVATLDGALVADAEEFDRADAAANTASADDELRDAAPRARAEVESKAAREAPKASSKSAGPSAAPSAAPPPAPSLAAESLAAGAVDAWYSGMETSARQRVESAIAEATALSRQDPAGAARNLQPYITPPPRAGMHVAALAARWAITGGDPRLAASICERGLKLGGIDTPERQQVQALLTEARSKIAQMQAPGY
jgi:hypothetical protein